MAKFIGRRTTVGIGKETSRGTAVTPDFWIPQASISFDQSVTKERSEEGFGNIQEGSDSHITQIMGEGELEAEMRADALGLILLGTFGSVSSSTAGGESSVYEHDYTLQNSNQHQALSVLMQDPIQAKMMPLSMVNSLTFTVEPEGIVKYTVGFMSKGAEDWTTQTETYTSDSYKFLHQHFAFKVAADIASLGAASKSSVKSFEMTISKNTVTDHVAGTLQPEDVLNQQFSVSGSITLNHEDNTFRGYDLDNTYRAMEARFTHPTTIGTAENSELNIQLPRVSFSEWERDRSLNEIVSQTIQFQGNYDATNGQDVIENCILTNETASY